VSTLQNATADRRQLADEQTEAEHDATFSDNTGSKVFLAINQEGVHLLNFNGTSLPELKPGVNVPDCTSFVASHSDVWKQGSAYIVAAGLLSE